MLEQAPGAEGAPAATNEHGHLSQIVRPCTMFLRQLVLFVAPHRAQAGAPGCRKGGLGATAIKQWTTTAVATAAGTQQRAAPLPGFSWVFALQEHSPSSAHTFVSVEGRAAPIAVRACVQAGDGGLAIAARLV